MAEAKGRMKKDPTASVTIVARSRLAGSGVIVGVALGESATMSG